MPPDRPMPLLEWPVATPATMMWFALVILALALAVILWELHRRRAEAARQVKAKWRIVEDIAREKDLSGEQREALRALIRRRSPREPVRAVTVRQHFDACVEEEMGAVRAKEDRASFEERGQLLRDIRLALNLDFVPLGQRIVSTRELGPGQLIWVARASDSQPQWRRATVVSVNEACLHAAPPDARDSETWSATPGETLRCRMWRDEDARYGFDTQAARVETDPPSWVLDHTSSLERVQARTHHRVLYGQAVTAGVLDAPVDGDESHVRDRRVVTRLRGHFTSLSAGGFALLLQQPAPRQVLLRVPLHLPGSSPFEAEARIVSTSSVSGGRWLVRASFVGLDDDRRDRIARYVFQCQQPLLRTGARPV